MIEDFENQTTEAWRAALEVNLTAFDLSRGFYRLLKHSSNGNILNVGSIYGLIGPDLRITMTPQWAILQLALPRKVG